MTGGAGRGEAMATGAAVRVVTGTWNPGTCIPSTSTQTVTVTSSVAMDATMMVISRSLYRG